MKHLILFVAIIMLVKPLWPLAEYAVNYDYIVENLCENRATPSLHCDGKCYLAKQLAKESEGSDKNPFEGKRFNLEIQYLSSFDSLFVLGSANEYDDTVQNNYKGIQTLIPGLYTTDIAQPPELG
ncbi:hypothetical protein [Arenibacter troitsensis]|uniref:Uncharacterized protein n=1 Tax=Arenibacter troitsensis TaxID=188872 RepID=A0A1X7K9C6_9FLAO|nr:hypothetical protein [Arenibacter troitsensis]SMG37362.1 hypothetical protein SAMN03080602_02627 [Arenibacter troitsensis]